MECNVETIRAAPHHGLTIYMYIMFQLDWMYTVRGVSRKQNVYKNFQMRTGGRGFNSRQGRQHSFVEIDHEIFSTVILSLPLIQEGKLSVSGERMCTILVNCLED